MEKNSIIINGNSFNFNSNETILDVARKNNIDIPTLCYLEKATPIESCMVCVVEIENADKLLSACSTLAKHQMVVYTESEKVIEARKFVIKNMLLSGNHNCAVFNANSKNWSDFQHEVSKYENSYDLCPSWGECKLQDLAFKYQVFIDSSMTEEGETKKQLYPKEDVNPFIVRDFSRCVLCGRCVSVCNEIQVNCAIEFGYKGEKTKIIAKNNDVPLKDSDCVFCGQCIQVCPVGALIEKKKRISGQGEDGRVQEEKPLQTSLKPWETKKVRTTCSYCGVGCQIYLHVKDDIVVKVTGADGFAPNYGNLCVKGRFGFDFIHSEKRLKHPLIKKNNEFREATWDEANELVAKKLGEIKDKYGSDSIGLLASARISNEDNYVAQKF